MAVISVTDKSLQSNSMCRRSRVWPCRPCAEFEEEPSSAESKPNSGDEPGLNRFGHDPGNSVCITAAACQYSEARGLHGADLQPSKVGEGGPLSDARATVIGGQRGPRVDLSGCRGAPTVSSDCRQGKPVRVVFDSFVVSSLPLGARPATHSEMATVRVPPPNTDGYIRGFQCCFQ